MPLLQLRTLGKISQYGQVRLTHILLHTSKVLASPNSPHMQQSIIRAQSWTSLRLRILMSTKLTRLAR